MLPGFPKNVTKEKVRRGHYRLTRDDGFTVEVKHGVGGWWFGKTGRKVKSLGVAEYDLRNGYTSRDQVGVGADDRPEVQRAAAWETAMGMRGYAGWRTPSAELLGITTPGYLAEGECAYFVAARLTKAEGR